MTDTKSESRWPWLGRAIFESVLIIFSVVLALGLNEIRQEMADREARREVVDNIRQELTENLAVVENRYLPAHQAALNKVRRLRNDPDALERLRSRGVGFDDLSDGPFVDALLRDTAWVVTNSSGSAHLVHYGERFALTTVYELQDQGVKRTLDLIFNFLLSSEFGAPETTDRDLERIERLLTELVGQEEFLRYALNDVLDNEEVWSAL